MSRPPQNRASESPRTRLKQLAESSRSPMAHQLTGAPGFVYPCGYPTFPLDEPSSPYPVDPSPGHVSTLSGWVSPYPAGYGFPVPFGCRHSLVGRPIPLRHGLYLTVSLLPRADLIGVPTFRIGKMRRASWPLDAGNWAPSQSARKHRLTTVPIRTSPPPASRCA